MDENEAIRHSLQLMDVLPDFSSADFKETRQTLMSAIDELLHRDFSKLMTILYRIDVDENKLKKVLFETSLPPAEAIADLIIERQIQKIKFRELFRNKNNS